MRRPLALFVGLRYLRASKGSGFVSFVTGASVIGVTLGVATLIVVLSVMNGFEIELRTRLLGLTAHASVTEKGGLADWQTLADGLSRQPGIEGAAPYIELEALLSGPSGMAGALVTGVEPALERGVSRIADNVVVGRFEALAEGAGSVILGRALAARIGAVPGGRVSVLVPRPAEGGVVGSELGSFRVAGLFELGVQDHDAGRALIALGDAARLARTGERVSGLRIETGDIFSAPRVVRQALAEVSDDARYRVRDWTEENASYFRAIRIEKIMMALLLSLIIGVAAFNIVAMLVMVVTEKRSGIAILRTLGCRRRTVIGIFVLQGTLIGWVGALAGVLLGVWMALNVDSLAPALESAFGFQFMPADLYYLTALPSELRTGDVILTAGAVFLMTALATVYPAIRAAGVQPAEVLRYE